MPIHDHHHALRKLTKILFFSGALNIFFIFLFIYWVLSEKPPRPYYELKPAEKKEEQLPLALNFTNAELLRQFRSFSDHSLMVKLSDNKQVENGYSQRDLALACLVQFHYFDIEKALKINFQDLQKRILAYGRFQNGTLAEIALFPGLTSIQYEKLVDYVHKEKWPFTSKGLFLKIKEAISKKAFTDPSLIDAFCLTPEYLAIELLFMRSQIPLKKTEILLLLSEGTWDAIFSFTEHQRAIQDLSDAKRQKFLLDLVDQGSRTAAYILLKTDGRFAATKLDDSYVVKILNLMTDKTELAQQYALALLKSPRADEVLKIAARRLYEYAGETAPAQIIPYEAITRFVQKNRVDSIQVPSLQSKVMVTPTLHNLNIPLATVRYYIVQEGDSLWKISKLYKADIQSIKKLNNLQSDFLKPGIQLKIPL